MFLLEKTTLGEAQWRKDESNVNILHATGMKPTTGELRPGEQKKIAVVIRAEDGGSALMWLKRQDTFQIRWPFTLQLCLYDKRIWTEIGEQKGRNRKVGRKIISKMKLPSKIRNTFQHLEKLGEDQDDDMLFPWSNGTMDSNLCVKNKLEWNSKEILKEESTLK